MSNSRGERTKIMISSEVRPRQALLLHLTSIVSVDSDKNVPDLWQKTKFNEVVSDSGLSVGVFFLS